MSYLWCNLLLLLWQRCQRIVTRPGNVWFWWSRFIVMLGINSDLVMVSSQVCSQLFMSSLLVMQLW